MFVPISYFHIFRQSLKTLRHIYFTRAAVIQLRHFPKIKKAAARTASIIGLCILSFSPIGSTSFHPLPPHTVFPRKNPHCSFPPIPVPNGYERALSKTLIVYLYIFCFSFPFTHNLQTVLWAFYTCTIRLFPPSAD